jgi:hypothetical protein
MSNRVWNESQTDADTALPVRLLQHRPEQIRAEMTVVRHGTFFVVNH